MTCNCLPEIKEEEARDRIQSAAEELRAEGLPVTVRAVNRKAGGSFRDISRYLKEALWSVLPSASINTCSNTLPGGNTLHKGDKPDVGNGKKSIGAGVSDDSDAGNGKTTSEQTPPVTRPEKPARVIFPKVGNIDGKDRKPPANLKGAALADWFFREATAHLHVEEVTP